ncbi:lamin tail domain-containing protein [Streptomyces sp. NBC_01261]|uniref:lamin tail domain-containing protein n=1 Tax=Streptomyces sp. NBC_01261 TaxID=2903802 RepID=UPI002E33F2F0|nr:lamin tail domain-containing protein [Streptomyces sp. NBC_01261]
MLGEPVTSSPSVSVRRLAAAALAAGALVGAAALPATAADHHAVRANVEISRVQYDSPGPEDRSNRSLNNEWVEITNHTRSAVNLDGWKLSNKDGQTYTFHHYRLDGHATVRVHTGVGRDTNRDLYQDRHNYTWDNHSDTATLRNDHRRLVDDESWGNHGGGHGGGGHNGGGGHGGGGGHNGGGGHGGGGHH